jgi:predicted transcriptional regulator
MSKLRNLKRKLQPDKVRIAEQVQYERVQFARNMVKERCEKDAEFAKDVLKALGENLPREIKETCEKTISEDSKVIEESSALQKEKTFGRNS